MIIDVTPSVLIDIVGEENTVKIMRKLKGCRLYIPKCKTLQDEIKQDYETMTSDHHQRVKDLAAYYEMSESNIRKILRKQGGLFEEY